MKVSEEYPYGKYHITIKDNAPIQDIEKLLQDDLPFEIQIKEKQPMIFLLGEK